MDHCYWKNPLNYAVDRAQSGQVAAILDFWCMTVVISGVYIGLCIWTLSNF